MSFFHLLFLFYFLLSLFLSFLLSSFVLLPFLPFYISSSFTSLSIISIHFFLSLCFYFTHLSLLSSYSTLYSILIIPSSMGPLSLRRFLLFRFLLRHLFLCLSILAFLSVSIAPILFQFFHSLCILSIFLFLSHLLFCCYSN